MAHGTGASTVGDVHEFTPKPVALPGFLPQLAQRFLQQLEANNYALNTRVAYQTDLEQFAGFLAARDLHYVHLVGTATIEDFIVALTHGAGNSPRTAARKLETVKRFFAWLHVRELIKHNPAPAVTPVKFSARHVVAPEGAVLLRVIASVRGDSAEAVRDRALLRLLYDAGLRASAVLSLDVYSAEAPPVSTVHPDGRVTYTAKGGRAETAVCDAGTLEHINLWLARRPRYAKATSPPALFLTRVGGRPTRSALYQMVLRRGKEVGLDHLHPHLFRHRRAFELMEGAGARAAQMQLGHSCLSTTIHSYGFEHANILRAAVRRVPIGGASHGGAA